MNSKVTFALLAAALAAGGYLFWFDRDRPGTQAATVAGRKVLPAGATAGKVAPIDRLEISGPEGKVVLALDKARVWHVLVPAADRANPKVLRELVETLETSLKFDTLRAAPSDLERLGLGAPATQLKIFRRGEEPVELQLGAKTAVEGRIYARVAGSAEVIVVPEAIESLCETRTPDRFSRYSTHRSAGGGSRGSIGAKRMGQFRAAARPRPLGPDKAGARAG